MTYIRHSAPRCTSCGQPQGEPHAAGCQFEQFTIQSSMAKSKPTAPLTGSVADLVSRHLYKSGPMTEADLYLAVDFGIAPSKRYGRLSHAISTGWIAQTDGKLACSPTARAHYDALDGTPEAVKPLGQAATVRQVPNVFERAPLSRRHIPSTRGLREVPPWSVRPGGFSVKSANGEKV